MEQHPVPQNVTTFQFRLIGDMTIKQFGYLAGGAILAYISYKLPVPFFFSWPLALIFGVGGFGFAFVPVEERPMDVWVMSFIKNIYSPTQFVWSHQAEPAKPKAPAPLPPPPAISAVGGAKAAPVKSADAKPVSDVLQRIFTPVPVPPKRDGTGQAPRATPALVHPVAGPFDWLLKLFSPVTRPNVPATVAAPISVPSVTGRHLDLSTPPKVTTAPAETRAQDEEKKEELDAKAKELERALEEKTQTHARILELQKQLMEILEERDRMRKEMSALRKTSIPAADKFQPAAPAPPPPEGGVPATASRATAVATPPSGGPRQPTVKIITPEGAVKAGLPRLTTFPNVVTGITRDSDNNLLPGVLVTVRDKDGVPVRALKTNRLGQFAASTPIANGTYLVEIEDPRGRYVFDRAQVTLNGSIVPALEIIARSQREVAREKLAKEIFGNT